MNEITKEMIYKVGHIKMKKSDSQKYTKNTLEKLLSISTEYKKPLIHFLKLSNMYHIEEKNIWK